MQVPAVQHPCARNVGSSERKIFDRERARDALTPGPRPQIPVGQVTEPVIHLGQVTERVVFFRLLGLVDYFMCVHWA